MEIMGLIKITCDSTADLSEELLNQYNIDTIPMYINLDGKSYKDGVEIYPEDIYDYVNKTGNLPKTAAVSIKDYLDFFGRFHKDYDAVIHINLGDQFSSSHQNAKIAAGEFHNVYAFNSENLSTGTGHLVLEAAKMAEKGFSAREIIEELQSLVKKIESSFVIDTLDYLHKGGRCSSLAALGASLLNIKPNIEVLNGKMEVGKKYRGKIEKAINKYVADRLEGRTDIVTDRIFITHSGVSDEIIENVRVTIQNYQSFDEIVVTRASCTISCHCGPNTLGILFKRK